MVYLDMYIGNRRSIFTTFLITIILIVHTNTENATFKLRRWNDGLNIAKPGSEPEKVDVLKDEWYFKDYIKKFRPINVWERLYQKRKTQGLNTSIEKNYEEVMDGIDETDEILRVSLNETVSGGRRTKWSPPGMIDGLIGQHDPYSARRRLYELILHTMYWTRNKMTIMQTFRKKYRRSKIYKMGFMTSKNDIQCKMFHRFAHRAMSTCITAAYQYQYRYYPIEMLHAEERMLSKWMDISLLTDLITRNDVTCKEMLDETNRNREQAWVFYD